MHMEQIVRTAGASSPPSLRGGTAADLSAVNAVIERAVMAWKLPERVKRLALPTYLYSAQDLEHVEIVIAENGAVGVLGVAAWEPAPERDGPQGRRGLQLHGIYVDPNQQRRGVGARLLSAAAAAAREQGYEGLLVKAQADAEGFFATQGLQRLAVEDTRRDYPHRFWLDLTARQAA
jgi:GNAT superfamily N-acetyltransferase